MKNAGGRVSFVRLTCDHAELFKRVRHADRKRFQKLTSSSLLRRLLKTYHLEEDIAFTESLSIDTTHLSPAQTARRIMQIDLSWQRTRPVVPQGYDKAKSVDVRNTIKPASRGTLSEAGRMQ